MARLRRSSPTERDESSDDDFPRQQVGPLDRSLQQLRSSPRKKTGIKYSEKLDSDDDSANVATLKPKNFSEMSASTSGRRIQLKSLQSLGTPTLSDSPFNFAEESRRSKPLLKGSALERRRLVATTSRLEQEDAPKIDQCSPSEDDSDESEDDLPSPWRMMGLPCKPTRIQTKTPIDLPSLSRNLGDLSLMKTSPRAIRKESQTPRKQDSSADAIQRRMSESDREDLADFLSFSPPRLNTSPQKTACPERPITPPPQSPSKSRLQSPSKSRLQSPSKTKPKIPSPSLRESLDAFWNAGTINDWNDQYSPQKPLRSPKKLKLPTQEDHQRSPTSSPRKQASPTKRSKAELDRRRDFAARKHGIAEEFLAELDDLVAEGKIGQLARETGGVRFVWSKSLNSTAGRANWRRETTKSRQSDGSVLQTHRHHASIELAEKVIDDEYRLLNVIAHEFCHLCNFMISGIKDQPHGAQFKVWGRKCTAVLGHRGVEVTTKHSYEIDYKYVWQCSNEECGAEFRRHSKSIDPRKHTCGRCRSKILQIKPVPRKDASGGATGYAAYVKEHFADVKKSLPGASHKEVMEEIGRKYRAMKSIEAGISIQDPVDLEQNGSMSSVEVSESVDSVARVLEFVNLDD